MHTYCQTQSRAIVTSLYCERTFPIHTFLCTSFSRLPPILCLETFPPLQIRLQHMFNEFQSQFPTQWGQIFADLLVIENEILCGEVLSNLGNKQSCAPQHSELTPPHLPPVPFFAALFSSRFLMIELVPVLS